MDKEYSVFNVFILRIVYSFTFKKFFYKKVNFVLIADILSQLLKMIRISTYLSIWVAFLFTSDLNAYARNFFMFFSVIVLKTFQQIEWLIYLSLFYTIVLFLYLLFLIAMEIILS